jgi:hypothetical protein
MTAAGLKRRHTALTIHAIATAMIDYRICNCATPASPLSRKGFEARLAPPADPASIQAASGALL